jgi:uncharacterized protein (DUF111 family)
MKILRFDSVGGASGDMILGALVGLGVDPRYIERELRRLIPDPFALKVGEKSEFGANGVYLTVDLNPTPDDECAVCEERFACVCKRNPDGDPDCECVCKRKDKRERKCKRKHAVEYKHERKSDCDHGHKHDCDHKHIEKP